MQTRDFTIKMKHLCRWENMRAVPLSQGLGMINNRDDSCNCRNTEPAELVFIIYYLWTVRVSLRNQPDSSIDLDCLYHPVI